MSLTRREFVASAAAAALTAVARAQAPARPNILWLVSEDNDRLLGCYGDALARTPTIDRLAREGVTYDRCFAQPVCAPSRFTLIAGMYAVGCGPAHHMRAQGHLPAWLRGFPELLHAAGYFTSNNAKTDYNSPINPRATWDAQGKQAHWRGRRPGQPFFSVFNHEVTHESCLFPVRDGQLDFTPTDPAKVRVPPYQPDTPAIRADWARYYDRMKVLDEQLAEKLAQLAADGLAEDTIVFYYSDNGGVLPRSKRFLQASGTLVPLVVYYPPKWRHLAPAAPGGRVSDVVHFIDFAPTVLSLAGVKVPAYMQGQPFAGPAKPPTAREYAYCTRDRMDERYDMLRSVMDRDWLYIRNYRPDLPYVQPLEYQFRARGYQSWAAEAAAGRLTAATSQFWGRKPSEELYNLRDDPDNVRNLASDPAHRATLDRLRAALARWVVEVKDNGFLPEGSPLEGYDASHAPGAWPVERVHELANAASDRDPANVARFVAALADPSEPVRWWAAQGCTILGDRASAAREALVKALADTSGAVQVAAAEALARQGAVELALPVLKRWLTQTAHGPCSLQAANVVDRLGEAARPLLPVLRPLLEGDRAYDGRIIHRIVDVLDGRAPALVYP